MAVPNGPGRQSVTFFVSFSVHDNSRCRVAVFRLDPTSPQPPHRYTTCISICISAACPLGSEVVPPPAYM